MVSAREDQEKALEVILERPGVDKHAAMAQALWLAADKSLTGVARMLSDAGADANHVSEKGVSVSALQLAIARGSEDIVPCSLTLERMRTVSLISGSRC